MSAGAELPGRASGPPATPDPARDSGAETAEELLERFGPRYRIYLTIVSMIGTIATILTTTSVNVAVPDIMGSFGIGQERAQWLSAGNLAGVTVGMLMSAWLVEYFGQRRTFVGGLALFVGSLFLSALAPNAETLFVMRIVQGVITGIMQTMVMSTLFMVFPPGQRGTAMGFFSINVILGPTIGPIFGGLLIEHFNWRYVFTMSIPFSVIGMLLGMVFMPGRARDQARPRFDWIGCLLISAAIGCLLTGLASGQREGWASDYVLGLLTGGCASLALFTWWELRIAQPMVDLRVLGRGEFAAATIVSWVFGFGLFGTTYLIPLFVQSIQHYSAFEAGLLLTPGALALAVAMPIGGYLSDRYSNRMLIMIGLFGFAVSTWVMGVVDANTAFWHMALATALGRASQALINPTLNVTALRALPMEAVRQGAGMINFSRQLGGAFGVNLLSVLLDRRTAMYSNELATTQSSSVGATGELLRIIERQLAIDGAPPLLQQQGALHFLGRMIHEQAYSLAFRDSFVAVTAVFALAMLVTLRIGRSGRAGRQGRPVR